MEKSLGIMQEKVTNPANSEIWDVLGNWKQTLNKPLNVYLFTQIEFECWAFWSSLVPVYLKNGLE